MVSARVKFIIITVDELILVPIAIVLAYLFIPDLLIPITIVVIIGAIIFVAVKYYLVYPTLKQTSSYELYEMIGIVGFAVEDVTSVSGKIRVGSELWDARSKTGDIIVKGSKAKVVSRTGMKLYVVSYDQDQ